MQAMGLGQATGLGLKNTMRFGVVSLAFIGTISAAHADQVPPTDKPSDKSSDKKANTKASKKNPTSSADTSAKPPVNPYLDKSGRIDWTPVLKTMQNGCDLPDIDNAPMEILASIRTDSGERGGTDKITDGYKTLQLSNASAFGYPIRKIYFGSQGAGFSSATIYFTDNRFLALRPRFYVQTVAGKLTAKDKMVITDRNAFAGQYLANGMGYSDGRSGVIFSPKTHSITCSWAHL